jgi:hypothetical protein
MANILETNTDSFGVHYLLIKRFQCVCFFLGFADFFVPLDRRRAAGDGDLVRAADRRSLEWTGKTNVRCCHKGISKKMLQILNLEKNVICVVLIQTKDKESADILTQAMTTVGPIHGMNSRLLTDLKKRVEIYIYIHPGT